MRFFSRRRAKEQEERPEAFVSAIIVAAGQSRRMGGDTSKQFILIDGVPVIVRTLKAFEIAERIREVVIAARQEDIPQMYALIQDYEITKVKQIITGGETRQESVFRAIAQVDENADFLAIHDGARPLIRPQEIDLAVSAAVEHGAAALGVPVKDTVKQVDADGKIVDTPERSTLWAVQTPQVFSRALYLRAAEQAGGCGAVDGRLPADRTNGSPRLPGTRSLCQPENHNTGGCVCGRGHLKSYRGFLWVSAP